MKFYISGLLNNGRIFVRIYVRRASA